MTQTGTLPLPEAISLDFKLDIQRLTQGFVGRAWVFREIDRWLATPEAPRVFVITGEPGIGKSAIAARLTQLRDDIGAYHFCIARRADTIDPLNFGRSLAQQLARFGGFARAILHESNTVVMTDIDVRENYGEVVGVRIHTLIINARSASRAFQQSVLEPLRAFAGSLARPLLIVVDSLDEAARHRSDETIVDLLANAGALPAQVRFVLTSRPEGEVLRHFQERNIPHIELKAKGEDNRADVRAYLDGQYAASSELQARVSESGLTREQFVERLLKTSGGNFLYLFWLLPEIAAGRQLLTEQAQLPVGLDGIYREFLRTQTVGEDLRGKWRSLYRPLLGVLIAARAPLDVAQLKRFTYLSRQRMVDAVEDVRQFLDPDEAARERYALYHQSLSDFLRDRARAEEFWIEKDPFDFGRHGGVIQAIALTPDGRRAISVDDQAIRAWDIDTAKPLWVRAYPLRQVIQVIVTPDGSRFALIAWGDRSNEQLTVWDTATGSILRVINDSAVNWFGHFAVTRDLRTAIGIRIDDHALLVWNLEGGTNVRIVGWHPDMVRATALTPDGHRAVTICRDDALRVWDLGAARLARPMPGHDNWPVEALALTPDGARAVSGAFDGSLKVWEVETGRELFTLPGHGRKITALAIIPSGQEVIAGSDDDELQVYGMENGEARTLGKQAYEFSPVAVTPDGRRALWVSGDYMLCLWGLESGTEVYRRHAHTHEICSIVVTADGQQAVTASWDHTVKVWDLESGEVLAAFTGESAMRCCVVTRDGRAIVAGDAGGQVHVLKLCR